MTSSLTLTLTTFKVDDYDDLDLWDVRLAVASALISSLLIWRRSPLHNMGWRDVGSWTI